MKYIQMRQFTIIISGKAMTSIVKNYILMTQCTLKIPYSVTYTVGSQYQPRKTLPPVSRYY